MFEVEYTGDDFEKEFSEAAERAKNLDGANVDVQRAMIRQNRGVNFDPLHPDSIIGRTSEGWEIGSQNDHYGGLLDIDDEEIADLLVEYITGED